MRGVFGTISGEFRGTTQPFVANHQPIRTCFRSGLQPQIIIQPSFQEDKRTDPKPIRKSGIKKHFFYTRKGIYLIKIRIFVPEKVYSLVIFPL